jgi:hypothetical protein
MRRVIRVAPSSSPEVAQLVLPLLHRPLNCCKALTEFQCGFLRNAVVNPAGDARVRVYREAIVMIAMSASGVGGCVRMTAWIIRDPAPTSPMSSLLV